VVWNIRDAADSDITDSEVVVDTAGLCLRVHRPEAQAANLTVATVDITPHPACFTFEVEVRGKSINGCGVECNPCLDADMNPGKLPCDVSAHDATTLRDVCLTVKRDPSVVACPNEQLVIMGGGQTKNVTLVAVATPTPTEMVSPTETAIAADSPTPTETPIVADSPTETPIQVDSPTPTETPIVGDSPTVTPTP